jgi:CxxC-x17-CxxC domain-containing protein
MIKISRERYASERTAVEDKIMRWHSNDDADTSLPVAKKNVFQDRSVKNNNFVNKAKTELEDKKNINFQSAKKEINQEEVYKYKVNCARCSKETRISFEPDGIRPVYCKDCLKEVREEKKIEITSRKLAKKNELKKLESDLEKNIRKSEPISLNEALKMQPVGFTKKSLNRKEENYSPSPPVFKKTEKKDQDSPSINTNILDVNSGGVIKF